MKKKNQKYNTQQKTQLPCLRRNRLVEAGVLWRVQLHEVVFFVERSKLCLIRTGHIELKIVA